MVLKVSKEFQTAHGKAYQQLSLEETLETRPAAKTSLKNFLIDCNKLFDDFQFELGPDKDLETARNKAVRDYKGDDRQVTDYVRAKGHVTSAKTIRQLKSPEFEDLLTEHGIEIAEFNDYFEDPKDQTGYRCLNFKLAVPVGTYPDGSVKRHVLELQVVADQIEAVYDETHIYKRRAENAKTKIEALIEEHNMRELIDRDMRDGDLARDEEVKLANFFAIIKPFKKIEKLNHAACRLLNGRAARGENPEDFDQNYEELIKPELRSKHYLFPGREEHLETQMFHADSLENE